MVGHPGEDRRSSHAAHVQDREDPLIRDHREYLALGGTCKERQRAYRALFRSRLGAAEVAAIRSALNECRVYCSKRFKDTIKAARKRRVRAGKSERPRKVKVPASKRISV